MSAIELESEREKRWKTYPAKSEEVLLLLEGCDLFL